MLTQKLKWTLSTLLLSTGLAIASPASAALVSYTDESSFLAAVGSASVETLDSLTSDIAPSGSTDLGAFSISGNATVDAPTTAINISGSTNLFINTSYGGYMDFIFDEPIKAFGVTMVNSRLQLLNINFDRVGPAYGEYHHIDSYLSSDPYVSDISFNGFLGFTSDTAFNRVIFSGAAGCCSSTFALDNITYATETTAPVPEPSSAALLGCGLIALIGLRRRYRLTA